ncbi:hypothetical protein HYALB_00002699 [Hymenoscyphus albidus]|uniref:Uncharacterized protein n=1 Tax=Hymenoscyphus albidus TaxID=595503 RepID=A0A9N9Q2B7_9HELO|nr:hypothetical protein HYALB_00002699 [Hymenoscyphus albidus]
MEYYRAIGLDRRQQNAPARFAVHEDSDKENRAARLLGKADDETDRPRFRYLLPIPSKGASGSGWTEYTSDGIEEESEYIEEKTEMLDVTNEQDESGYEVYNEERIDNKKDIQGKHDSDSLRHAEAYSRMIKGAAPPISTCNPQDEAISKKRSREIYESGTSSSNMPLSPHKYVNSPPRRPGKRTCTPPSGGRRKSAPSNLERSPRAFPEHIVTGVQKLREKHEGSIFELGDTSVRCVDCNQTFQIPAKTKSLAGPNIHCRAAPHRLAVQKRILQQERDESPLLKTSSKVADFDVSPQPPVTALNSHGYAGFANPLGDVFTALQRSSTETYNQHMAAKQRLDTIEKQLNAQTGHFTSILEPNRGRDSIEEGTGRFRRKNAAAKRQYYGRISFLEDRNDNNNTQVENKFAALKEDSQKSQSENHDEFAALPASIMESTEKNKQQLSVINNELVAAIRYNSQQIQETRHDISPLNNHMSEQLQRNFSLDGQLKHHWSSISAQTHYNNENHPRFLAIEDLTRHHRNYIIQLQEEIKRLGTRADNHDSAFKRGQSVEMVIRDEIKKLRESDHQLQRKIQPTIPSLPRLPQQRHEENEISSTQSFVEQVGAQLATRFDARLKSMEDTFEARLATVQSESNKQISLLQAQATKQIQVMQALEKENSKLRSCIPIINKDIQEMSECFNEVIPDLGEKVESLEHQLSTLDSLLPGPTRNHTTQQPLEDEPRHPVQKEMDLVEARFQRIETAIPALFEQISYIRDCFEESAEEGDDRVEDPNDYDNLEPRLNRIEAILPVVIQEATELRACVDDLGEILGSEKDPRANDESENENEDLLKEEAESDREEGVADHIKEEDFDG